MKCNLCKLILTKRGPQKEELPRRTPEKKGEFYEVSRATSSHNYKEDTRRKIIIIVLWPEGPSGRRPGNKAQNNRSI
jgi:hypothetical protein